VLGRNSEYGADIIDTALPEWRAFVLDRVSSRLYQKGYRGFFSTRSIATSALPRRVVACSCGGLSPSCALCARHPDAKILLNRGFEMLPQVHSGYWRRCRIALQHLANAGNYADRRPVPPARRGASWPPCATSTRAHLPIIVIDYVPVTAGSTREGVAAKKILALGFAPYITLRRGRGRRQRHRERLPPRLDPLQRDEGATSSARRRNVLVAPVMEWMGYRVDYHDVRRALPTHNLRAIRGIIVFLPDGTGTKPRWMRFLGKQLDAG